VLSAMEVNNTAGAALGARPPSNDSVLRDCLAGTAAAAAERSLLLGWLPLPVWPCCCLTPSPGASSRLEACSRLTSMQSYACGDAALFCGQQTAQHDCRS
jgi:hypothetical protein